MTVKRIFLKIFLASLPVLAMLAFYLIADPFLILYDYDDFFLTGKRHLELNEDYVQVENYIKYSKKEKYDAYVFGSSRSAAFTPEEWKKRVPGINPYYFGVASESLYGVEAKVNYIDKVGAEIKHVLLISDADLLSMNKNQPGHLFRKHPLISGENPLNFHLTAMLDFFTWEGVTSYLKLPPPPPPGKKDAMPNYKNPDAVIDENPKAYYDGIKDMFYERSGKTEYYDHVILGPEQQQLTNIQKILKKHNAEVKVVISPMYDQKKIDTTDLRFLQKLFGAENVYDFSGINVLTESMYNFYEPRHYRPFIANRVMDIMYLKKEPWPPVDTTTTPAK
jgi:hypothetical protein